MKKNPIYPDPLPPKQAAEMNAIVLAFVGDAVMTLSVRAELAATHSEKAHALHKRAASEINAHAQSLVADRILPLLNEAETAVYMRARNGKTAPPKNADPAEYKKATGLEAVVGYLYLSGQNERMSELFES
ncbi:MAG: ribonuclease III [Clostridiales bacterium]|nr:ribonuclease III [Clostridiales bacterium]